MFPVAEADDGRRFTVQNGRGEGWVHLFGIIMDGAEHQH